MFVSFHIEVGCSATKKKTNFKTINDAIIIIMKILMYCCCLETNHKGVN